MVPSSRFAVVARISALLLALTAAAELRAQRAAPTLLIEEFQVEGATLLTREQVESSVYPFLGPGRSADDVERARAALEQTYAELGYQTVSVQAPQQELDRGIIRLVVLERPVGRLRVRGATHSSPSVLKSLAPSLAEGGVVDFRRVASDLAALNQLPGREVTPALRAGADPDTVDVDLNVKESAPLRASVELNNRSGPDTTRLRLNSTVAATNLFQHGHALSLSFQTSPEKSDEVRVYSGYYLARFRDPDAPSLMFSATKQDSNVSTLGDIAVAGRGETAGVRVLFSLPGGAHFVQSARVGADYRHFNQKVRLAASTAGGADITTPITYFPLELSYSANWIHDTRSTEFNASAVLHFRGLGTRTEEFGLNRYNADANFLVLRADASHTESLPGGFEAYARISGQLADQPLLSQEQATGGGWGTVRGYLEAEQSGDSGAFGSAELRSPSFGSLLGWSRADWRLFVFADGGWLKVIEALPGEKNHYLLASWGAGSRLRLFDHVDGAVVVAQPQWKQSRTKAGATQVTFRLGLDY